MRVSKPLIAGEDRKLALIAPRLIAIMLARLRMNISECIDGYERLGPLVFGGHPFLVRNLQPLIPRRPLYIELGKGREIVIIVRSK